MQLALTNARIYPDPESEPIANGVVLIDGAGISAVGPGNDLPVPRDADILDCSGLTIVAGFSNSHVHFFERKWANAHEIPADELTRQLEDFTRYGFTSVFDLSSSWENTQHLRRRIDSGEVAGPRIRTTAEGLVPPNAVPSEIVTRVLGAMDTPLPVITSAPQGAAEARRLLERGADALKMFVSSQRSDPLSIETMEAVVRETHGAGKPVFVHPSNAPDISAAVRSGVDIIAHTTPGSGPWNEALLRQMREANVALIPTLALWKHAMRHDRLSVQETYVTTSVSQLRAWRERGGDVLFGTDYGAVDADPRPEYELMAQSGMTFTELLASLTTVPAKRFGVSNRAGRIAAHFDADLTVLQGDPAQHFAALAAVRYTIRAGKLAYRASEGSLAA